MGGQLWDKMKITISQRRVYHSESSVVRSAENFHSNKIIASDDDDDVGLQQFGKAMLRKTNVDHPVSRLD